MLHMLWSMPKYHYQFTAFKVNRSKEHKTLEQNSVESDCGREIQNLFVAWENTVQGRQCRYTMQSSVTDDLSHAACTEQKSPQENTCTCTTVRPVTLFVKSKFNTSWQSVFALFFYIFCLKKQICVKCIKSVESTVSSQPDNSLQIKS